MVENLERADLTAAKGLYNTAVYFFFEVEPNLG